MVRSDSEVPLFGAKLVQVESTAAASLEDLVGALREKLGLASTAQLRVKASGNDDELTETALNQIRAKGRGQLQVAVSEASAVLQ